MAHQAPWRRADALAQGGLAGGSGGSVGEEVTFVRTGADPTAVAGSAEPVPVIRRVAGSVSGAAGSANPAGDLDRFYELLRRLEAVVGGTRTLAACDGRMGWPTRGVYFFFEPGETRPDHVDERYDPEFLVVLDRHVRTLDGR